MSRRLRPLRLLAALLAVSTASLHARPAAPAVPVDPAPAGPPLFSNPGLETDSDNDGWPDGWARLAQGSEWLLEEGNRFIRLSCVTPGKMVMLYQEVAIPAGVGALELSWRQRVTGLKPGKQPWFDARIMLEFADEQRAKVKPAPPAPNTRRDTAGWVDRSVRFLVPENARMLQFMPSLFQVEAGSFDLDDIALKPVDPAPIIAKQKEREAAAAKARVPVEQDDKSKWPPAIRAEGNRLVTVEGGKEVWLQGVNVPSLEWSVAGEQVHKSVVVGIEEWNANVIRLPVKNDYWFGKGHTDGGKNYRAIIDQCVTLAANRGAYLVLDLHTYRAPKDEYLVFWTDAATRYKNHPAVIFDLMNEPFDTSWEVWRDGGFVGEKLTPDQAAFLSPEEKAKTRGFQSPGMQKMLDTVRATGARNMVLVGGLDYAYRLDGIVQGYGLKDHSDGQGIIYACHIYPWKSQWRKMLLDAAAKYPILLGEVGADAKKMTFMPLEQQEDWETWVPDMLGLIQQHRLHWTAWCFHPGASPRMLLNWDYEPTPWWGQQAKDALHGKQFPPPSRLR